MKHPVKTTFCLAVAVALGLSQTACSAMPWNDSPEDVVEEYLELVQQGEHSELMEYLDGSFNLEDASRAYLDEDVRTSDWRFHVYDDDVFDEDEDADDDHKLVHYRVENYVGDDEIGVFELTEANGDWQILNPLAKMSVENSTLAYGDINGVYTEDQVFWMLPGVYSMYSEMGGQIEIEDHQLFAVTNRILDPENYPEDDSDDPPRDLAVDYSVTDDVSDLVQEQTDWDFEACESMQSILDEDCILDASYVDSDEIYIEHTFLEGDEVSELSWEVIEPPVLGVEDHHGLRFEVEQAGSANLTVIDNDGTEYSAECDINRASGAAKFIDPQTISFDNLTFAPSCGEY